VSTIESASTPLDREGGPWRTRTRSKRTSLRRRHRSLRCSSTYRTTPQQYLQKVEAFVEAGPKVAEEKGLPVIAADPAKDVYMLGRLWQWYPALKFKKGQTYRLHLSSMDLVHGFSLFPLNLNFMVLPGYEYVLTLTPTTTGEVFVVCNEFL